MVAPGVLANDSDQNGDALTATLVSSVSNGALTLNADGSFTYIPNTGFTGTDNFTYQAKDDTALSNLATVLITVTATGGGNTAGVDNMETGLITGKGKNQTFTATTVFTQGDTVVIRSLVLDSAGSPVSDATVTTSITGPESTSVTSEPSDASDITETTWKTSSPKKGNSGTATNSYTATTSDVTANGFTWDEITTAVNFTLQ